MEDPKKNFYDLRIEAIIGYILMQIPCKNKGFLVFPNKNSTANISRVRKQKPPGNVAAREISLCLKPMIATERGKIKPHLGPIRLPFMVIGYGSAVRIFLLVVITAIGRLGGFFFFLFCLHGKSLAVRRLRAYYPYRQMGCVAL